MDDASDPIRRSVADDDDAGLPLPRIAMNVSVLQFVQTGFLELVARVLSQLLPPDQAETFLRHAADRKALISQSAWPQSLPV
jgi:hypothetical protein